MAAPESSQFSFSNGRRWLNWLSLFLGIAAVLALVVMANYLAAGHFQRYQMDRYSALKLSEQTHHVLDNLTNDVNITIFFDRGPNAANDDIYALASALLTEYEQACPRHIHVKTLDYGREVGDAKEFLSRRGLDGSKEKDFICFECGAESKTVYAKELANYDFSDALAGHTKFVRRSAFLGELYFTEYIYDVSNPHPAKAYFLSGHGENDPDENKANNGYSKLAGILKYELNCGWQKFSLLGTNAVPADCQVLIVAASANEGKMLPPEIEKIAAYLKQGGRMLALLTAPSGLESVLNDWGIDVGDNNNRVVDMDKHFNSGDPRTFVSANMAPHYIMSPLVSEKVPLPLLMVFPRPIYEAKNRSKLPGAPTVTVLAATSPQGMSESRQTAVFPLLAAVEQGGIQGVDGGTRIVVSGDSDFLDDQVIDYPGNHIFAKRALGWLLQRSEAGLTGLGPQPIREYKLYMTAAQAQAIRWLFLAGFPGVVLFFGTLVWLRRRS